jgi:hypothetical protein
MKNNFVNPENIENLEQYLCGLITGLISLRTLDGYHATADKKGLLNEDCEECAKMIMYDIRRLIQLYQKQITNIEELVELDVDSVLREFQKISEASKQKS